MRILFMGSGELACPALRALLEGARHEVAAVVSQPDRPRGRHLEVAPCPVKALAEERGLRVLTPEKIGSPDVVEALRGMAPEVIVLVAYGQYVPRSILAIPRAGAINLHPSLLPRYRGAAPIQWAIARGEAETGVTVLFVSEEMDAGDIILQRPVAIAPEDTAVTLAPRLAELGAALVVEALEEMEKGNVTRTPQDPSKVTLAPKLTRADGRLDWTQPAEALRNRVRGFQPWPGAACEAPKGSGRLVLVHKASVEAGRGRPGEVLDITGDGPLVAAGRDALRLLEVQPESRKRMTGAEYVRGYRLPPGETLG